MVFGPAQKLSLAELARDVVVEMALEGLLEGLHADRQLGMDRMKAANDLELHQMVVEAIVRLADQDDRLRASGISVSGRHRAEIQGSRRADRARGLGLEAPRYGKASDGVGDAEERRIRREWPARETHRRPCTARRVGSPGEGRLAPRRGASGTAGGWSSHRPAWIQYLTASAFERISSMPEPDEARHASRDRDMRERSVKLSVDPGLRDTRTVVLDQGDPEEKRNEIRRYFHQTYQIDEALIETLRYHETFYRRADPLRHPLIFYFGHTSVFFVNKLIIAKLIDKRIHPRFESMFAVGVDEMSWDDIDMSTTTGPKWKRSRLSRLVRELVDERIRSMPLPMPIGRDHPFWAIMMGIEHAHPPGDVLVLIRQLPVGELRRIRSGRAAAPLGGAPENRLSRSRPGRSGSARRRTTPSMAGTTVRRARGRDRCLPGVALW
jgi:hypothetical protein